MSDTVIGLYNDEDGSVIYLDNIDCGDIHSYGMWLRDVYNTREIILARFIESGEVRRAGSLKKYINDSLLVGVKNIYLFTKGDWAIYNKDDKKFERFLEEE